MARVVCTFQKLTLKPAFEVGQAAGMALGTTQPLLCLRVPSMTCTPFSGARGGAKPTRGRITNTLVAAPEEDERRAAFEFEPLLTQ